MNDFIGRTKELNALEREYRKPGLSSATIYGRRRIGKSSLAREFIKDKKAIFFQAMEESTSNLTELSKQIGITLFGTEGLRYQNYDDAFETVFTYTGQKMVFVIDELPYIAKKENPSILSILQRYMDKYQDSQSLMIIISGSSVSFMESEVLSTQGPLYGRFSLQIELTAFSIKESVKYLPQSWMLEERMEAHVITGGVPFYLKAFKGHENLRTALKEEVFNSFGGLYNEVRLFLSFEARTLSTYDTILSLLSKGVNSVTEIADKSAIDKSNVSAALKKLSTWRIAGEKKNVLRTKDRKKWQITDNFFLFHYKFVAPLRFRIENDIPIDLDSIKEDINRFISRSIEKDFMRYVLLSEYGNATEAGYGEFPNPLTKSNEEIDLVIKYDDGTFSVGECKWKKSKVGESVLCDLERKGALFSRKPIRKYFLLSRSGFEDSLIAIAKSNEKIMLITSKDLAT